MNWEIFRRYLLSILFLFLLSGIFSGCDSYDPSPGSIKININPLWSKKIELSDLNSAFANNGLSLPPLYEQAAGTSLHAVGIEFDIMSLPSGVSYNSVRIMLNNVKDVGTSGYPQNEDARIVTAIPLGIERTTDKENANKLAASFSAAIKDLSPGITIETSNTESYQKIYRTG